MKNITIIFFLFLITSVQAQVKFGKISKKELQKSISDIDPEASAEIISQEGNYAVTYDDIIQELELTKEITVRIKIYNKDKAPDDLLNVEIPLYIIGSKEEDFYGLKAGTYNLVDGKIKETKVNKEDIYEEEVSKYKKEVKFAFPNVQNGSILEYKYKVSSPRIYDLGTWYFQTTVPVLHNKFYVEYPDAFIYQKDIRGEVVGKNSINNKKGSGNFNFTTETLEYKNLSALKDEAFVHNTNNLRASVRFELKEYNNPGIGYKNYSMTWQQILKDLDLSSDYGGELRGNNFLNDEAESFKSISNVEERMSAIFDYVKTNFNWNEYVGLYPEKGVRKTFNSKVGNATDINFVLISMLNKAGIEAYPLVLSTVYNGILNVYPSKSKLNNTIAYVPMHNNYYLLDASAKYSKPNLLPFRDLNFTGYVLLKNQETKDIDLSNKILSEIKSTINFTIDDDKINGQFATTSNNYYAMNNLIKRDEDQLNFKNNLLNDYGFDAVSVDFKVNDKQDATRLVVKFIDEKSIETIGDKIFIQPLLFLKAESNDFSYSNQERKYPIEFGTPFTHHNRVTFQIPEGYELEFLPEDLTVKLPQDTGGYNMTFKEENGKILISALTHIAYSVLPQDFFPAVKDMYQKKIEVENKQIILKKK